MKVTVRYAFTDQVVPPRCRLPREVVQIGKIEVLIREVTSNAAPVAIVGKRKAGVNARNVPNVEWRWFNRKLWTAYDSLNGEVSAHTSGGSDWAYIIPGDIDLCGENGWNLPCFRSGLGVANHFCDDEARAQIAAWAKSCLVIDGTVYRVAAEPCYVLHTLGLGGDHGGTHLSVAESFNTNIRRDYYFPATCLSEAQEHGRQIAAERGDKVNVWLDPEVLIDVLIPEAVRLKRKRARRSA